MALTVIGLSGAVSHDPSAALYIDGTLVAAAEEERFLRDKHAKGRMPFEAAKFCLDFAGIKPADVDAVAIPFAPISIFGPARWHYTQRYWYAPIAGWTPSSPATGAFIATGSASRLACRNSASTSPGPRSCRSSTT